MDSTIGDFMRDAKKKQQSKKQKPLILSPIALSLAACGAGGDREGSGKNSEDSASYRPLSADRQSILYSFQEDEFSEGWWYQGQFNEPQLVSYFPQAVEIVDISSDGDLDVIVPLNKGYRTGIDTRHHFTVLENVGGELSFSSEMTDSTPFITGARRVETIHLERSDSDVLVTVAHDTAIEAETRYDIPWRMGDLSFTNLKNFQNISSELIPTNTLPQSFQTGRDSAVHAHSLAVGDINGDGRDDVFVGEFNSGFILFQTESGPLTYFTDDFMSNLGWNYRDADLPNATNVLLIDSHLADFNGDGFDDLLLGWGHGTAYSRIFYNNQQGNFDQSNSIALPVSVYGVDNNLHMKTFSSDLDSDGDLDILILQSRYDPFYSGTYIQYLEQSEPNVFIDVTSEKLVDPYQFEDTFGERLQWTNFWELMDIDTDGDDDLVGTSVKDQSPIIFLNDGEGNFAEANLKSSNITGQPIAWGDYDKDGKIEFVTWHSTWNDNLGTSSTNSFYLYEYDGVIA